jgi:F0F1-type ATP synthase assembly protein I
MSLLRLKDVLAEGRPVMIELDAGEQVVVASGASEFVSEADEINEKTAGSGVTVDGVLLKDSTVKTDTIIEKTSAAGVTADGVLLKDSTIALADGAVSNLSVKIGADTNNGIFGYSDVQLGFAVEGTLVGGADTSGLFTNVISEQTGTLGVTIDGVLLKDGAADFSGISPLFASQEAALIKIGTYTSAITIADTGASFIPIQVNLSSTGNAGTAGNQVAAARLRVDSDTNAQANTAIHCLQLRSDISTNVYAAALISASLNVSAATSLPTATMQGIYVAITGAGAITCPNNVNVLEAVYKQTAGGAGVDNVIEAACNASGCSLTNIIAVTNYAGTLTNGIAFNGTMDKGIQFSGMVPDFGSQEDAFIAIGTYTSALTIANTGATFVPIQVNLSSTGSTASPGSQVAAARLRVDTDTSANTNTAIHCLQLRSDLGTDVYAAALISASLNISAAVATPTATIQGFYVAITGNGAITCPNTVNVLEAVYKQTSGGAGVDNTIEAACNASGCALTNIIAVTNYAGTVTNGIKVSGQMTNGILVSDDRTGTWSGSVAGIRSTMTSSATAGIGNMYAGRFELIQSELPSSQGHTTALYVQTTVTGSTNNPTSVMSLVLNGGSGGNTTPFINFIDASTDKTLYLFEIGTGGVVADSGNGTALFETSAAIGATSEITHGLRVKVNGSDYYILMATEAAVAS